MRFTTNQYDEAIQDLNNAKRQLEPDGNCCSCCGDSGHQAFECGHNPLLAMANCAGIAKTAHELHEYLHYLAGWNFHMGEQLGPARVILPDGFVTNPKEMTDAPV